MRGMYVTKRMNILIYDGIFVFTFPSKLWLPVIIWGIKGASDIEDALSCLLNEGK